MHTRARRARMHATTNEQRQTTNQPTRGSQRAFIPSRADAHPPGSRTARCDHQQSAVDAHTERLARRGSELGQQFPNSGHEAPMRRVLLRGLAALLTCAPSRSAGDSWSSETERLTRADDATKAPWPPAHLVVTRLEPSQVMLSTERPALLDAATAAPNLWLQMPGLLHRISHSTEVVEGKRSFRARITPGCCAIESTTLQELWAKASDDDTKAADYHVFAGTLPRVVTRDLSWEELRPDALLSNSTLRRGSWGVSSNSRYSASEPLPTGREGALQARIAPFGTITPLHYDSGANVVLQVAGNKTWLLFPPAWLTVLSLYPKLHLRHRQSQLRLQDLANLAAHEEQLLQPECKVDVSELKDEHSLGLNRTFRDEVYRVDMRAGQILYVPPFWSHEVTAASVGADARDVGSLSLNLFTEAPGSAAIDDAYGVRLPLYPVRCKIISHSVFAWHSTISRITHLQMTKRYSVEMLRMQL